MQLWNHYRYKNLTMVSISVVVALYLLQNSYFRDALLHLGGWGYLGAFFAGILFVSTFTVSIGTIVLFILAQNGLSSLELGIFAGIGAVVGDFIIFQSVRSNDLMDEIRHVYEFFGGSKLNHLLNTRYFSWTLPVVGAILIASPLPDEIGVTLMGISHMKPLPFLCLSFVLNSIGIFVIVSAASIV